MRRRRAVAWAVAVLAALPSAVASGQDRGLLWEARGERGSVWLLGSMHFASDALYPLPTAVEEAFAVADVVAFEVDLDSAAQAGWKMLEKGMLGDGTLDQLVSAETLAAVRARLERRGLDPARFEGMKPWFLALNLTILELQGAGFDPQSGLDQHLFARATTAGKKRMALETVDFQLALFDSLEGAAADAFLRHTLHELDQVVPLIEDIMADWKAGDLESLQRLLLEGYEDFPDLFDALVRDRNRRWLEKVDGLLRSDDDVLLVVGALHLVGDDGLVAELRRRGYRVVRR